MSSSISNNSFKLTHLKLFFAFSIVILLLPILTYFPGLNGPLIFDDIPNIVLNSNIQMKQLSLTTLNEAAHSLSSGPFGRPLAGISFAINYYLADGTIQTFGYKAFNLAIHTINGLFVFWLVFLIMTRAQKLDFQSTKDLKNKTTIPLIAGICALLWVLHPIQVTSVLYVVQRMTSMAAMFMLLSLISYMYARLALLNKNTRKSIILFFTSLVAGIFGALCKETAVLLPLYIILIEFIFFNDVSPWNQWQALSKNWKSILFIGFVCFFVLLLIFLINFALPGYVNRDFNMVERILTESRILLFYLGQIILPRLSEFGIYHDDIPLSTSLLSPWTTLVSIAVIISMLFFAFRYHRKFALISFGVLWFFVSHVLESTFFPLELVHEHRNYLASIGPLMIAVSGLYVLMHKLKKSRLWILIPIIVLAFGITTTVRSMQWTQAKNLLENETLYHPESPRAWADLFIIYVKENMPDKAIASSLKSIHLRPNEPGHYLSLYLYTKSFNTELANFANTKLLKHIRDNPQSSNMLNSLHLIHKCLDTTCKDLQKNFEDWTTEALRHSNSPRLKYYHGTNLYARGNFEASLKFLNESISEGKAKHASPIIKRIQVLLALKKFDAARAAYAELQKLNEKYVYVSTSSMEEIQKVLSASEQIQQQ